MKTIKITERVHKLICLFGHKGETFDEIFERLIKNATNNNRK